MDISDNAFDPQQTGQPQQQQQQQQSASPAVLQGQQMQCDSSSIAFGSPQQQQFDGTTTHHQHHGPLGGPIPLPAPPQNYDKARSNAADIDFDSLLLQQFSCLGTRDHEDLIEQFHSLMNNQMNKDAARFFLEMSNWNLQTAVGCYLDFCNGQTLPSMKIIQQTQPNNQQVAWSLQNIGSESWPNGCYLMSNSQTRRIEVPTVRPGDTCEVVADLCTNEPVVWRLCTPYGEYFGDSLCLVTPGSFSSHEELNQRLAQLAVTEQNPAQFPQVNIVISERME
ncbi:protein ILRUN [Lucilia sericata]|uniref:protein ILRUN n=1 Tax=Lucilia sericata TaxID=13632 RepID=UPI0018A80619|nr:protein ILRUN [Lucilia sericata]XP_037805856.1 protein ILRUN [Lucilia sericata]